MAQVTASSIQQKRCSFQVLDSSDARPQNSPTNLVKDGAGFTWISTPTQLRRFNGYTFENIEPAINGKTLQLDKPVYLFALDNGSIWICNSHGILAYNPETNKFSSVVNTPAGKMGLPSVIPLLQSSGGIWCLNPSKGIVVYHLNGSLDSTSSITLPPTVSIDQSLYKSILNRDVISASAPFIFLQLDSRRLLVINTITQQSFIWSHLGKSILGFGNSASTLWIADSDSLLSFSLPGLKQTTAIPLSLNKNEDLDYCSIRSEENGKLLVSLNNEIREYHQHLTSFQRLVRPDQEPITGNEDIHHLIVDDQSHHIWLLTGNGIFGAKNQPVKFQHFAYPGDSINYIRSIYVDPQTHQILAGCIDAKTGEKGGLQVYDSLGNPLFGEKLNLPGLKKIYSIQKLTSKIFLISCLDGYGWYLYNSTTQKVEPYDFPLDPQVRDALYDVVWPSNQQRFNDSTIVIGCASNVYKCVFHGTALISAKPLLPFSCTQANSLNCFVYTKNGTLWAGTSQGVLYRVDPHGNARNLKIPGGEYIRCMAQDDAKELWVGTDKGLFLYGINGTLIRTFTTDTGLLDDYIYSIIPVPYETEVFVSTNRGLSSVPASGYIDNYTSQMGLQENQFVTQSRFRTYNDKMFFGGVNGITAFYPKNLEPEEDNPSLHLVSFAVNDSLLKGLSGIWQNDSLVLNYNQNKIRFDIAALGNFSAGKYLYKYMLMGKDTVWHTTSSPVGIEYHLSPGKYTLDVHARSLMPSTGSAEKQFTIVVKNRWWKSYWFKTLVIALGIAILILLLVWLGNQKPSRK